MTLINRLKKYVPISVKRYLGRRVMNLVSRFSSGTIKVRDGRIFQVIQDRVFLGVILNKEYEADLSTIASGLIRSGDTVVDVGANFGWYTTLFGHIVGQSGSVHSFEPFPRTFGILQKNVRLNGMGAYVHLNNVCVGETAGEVMMACDGASDSALAHVTSSDSDEAITVSSVRLDDSLEGVRGEIAYLKIDIEGFEYYALKGMQQLLQSENPPIIQIELNDEALQRASSDRESVVALLSGNQYRFFSIDPAQPQQLVESDALTGSDIFCMPPGQFAKRMQA